MTDSIGLLKAEVEKEEALLARETKQLQEMEKNAKRAETERKRQMKNASLTSVVEWFEIATNLLVSQEHPVLRHLDSFPQAQDSKPSEFTLADMRDNDTTFSEVGYYERMIVTARMLTCLLAGI